MHKFRVGDRVDSVYGFEHRGTVVEISSCPGCNGPLYHVERDSDGFVFIGQPLDLTPPISMN